MSYQPPKDIVNRVKAKTTISDRPRKNHRTFTTINRLKMSNLILNKVPAKNKSCGIFSAIKAIEKSGKSQRALESMELIVEHLGGPEQTSPKLLTQYAWSLFVRIKTKHR